MRHLDDMRTPGSSFVYVEATDARSLFPRIDTKDPLDVIGPTVPAPDLGSLKTEQQMKSYERYQALLTFDYEIREG